MVWWSAGLPDTFDAGFLFCFGMFAIGVFLYFAIDVAWSVHCGRRDAMIRHMIRKELDREEDEEDEEFVRRL